MKRLSLVLAVLMLTTVVLPSAVFAQADEPVSSDTPQQTEPSAPDATNNDRKSRIEEYKKRLSEKLSAVEERRLKNSCKAAQQIAANLANSVTEIQQRRQTAYDKVNESLNRLVAKLIEAGVDIAELEAANSEFSKQKDDYLSAINTYKLAVEDLTQMDCEADPEAFKAALTTAREVRVSIVSSSQSLRAYLTDVIKPILIEIKQQMSSAQPTN